MPNSPQEFEELARTELKKCRAKKPVTPRDKLNALDEKKCRLLGGHMIAWVNELSVPMRQERAMFGGLKGWHEDPLICILTDKPGCVAAQDMIGDEQEGFVWGYKNEFKFLEREDPEYKYHVTLQTYFDKRSGAVDLEEVAKRYPLKEKEKYLWHTDISTMGELFERGRQNLFKWDGKEIEMLEQGISEWVS